VVVLHEQDAVLHPRDPRRGAARPRLGHGLFEAHQKSTSCGPVSRTNPADGNVMAVPTADLSCAEGTHVRFPAPRLRWDGWVSVVVSATRICVPPFASLDALICPLIFGDFPRLGR